MSNNLLFSKVSRIIPAVSGVMGLLTLLSIMIARGDKVELKEVLTFLGSPNQAHQLAGINWIKENIIVGWPQDLESIVPRLPEGMSMAMTYADPETGEQMVINIIPEGEITISEVSPIVEVVAFTAMKLPRKNIEGETLDKGMVAPVIDRVIFMNEDGGCFETYGIDFKNLTAETAKTCFENDYPQELYTSSLESN